MFAKLGPIFALPLLLVLLAIALQPAVVQAASTFPPPPDGRLSPRESLDASRVALLSGRPDQAYRLMLLAQPDLGATTDWLDLASRVYLALDRPARIAETAMLSDPGDPVSQTRIRAALERIGAVPSRPVLQPVSRWPGFDKRTLKAVQSAVPGPGGSAYLLMEDSLIQVGANGQTQATSTLPGARDLCLDFASAPLALGEREILWAGEAIRLPAGILRPVSAAAAPDGSFFVLERGEPRLHRVSRRGNSMGSVPLAVGDPSRVRVDRAGRIYLVDRGEGRIRIYGADMVPVRTLGLSFAGKALRKIEDLAVDFAGNLLVVDHGTRRALLYSGSGQLLAATKEGTRVDAGGWDGLAALVILDTRAGELWRYSS